MADFDGDSQMNSSSSDEHDSDAMFPSEQQQTSKATSRLLQSSDLSPPNSQDASSANMLDFRSDDAMDMDHGEAQNSSTATGQMSISSVLADSKSERSQPGWAWKNKKAQEEYVRAMDSVVDKGFNLKQYGDPFDESENKEPQKL